MELQKMIHEIYPDEYSFATHAVNSVMMDGEYTLCGLDIVTTNLIYNGFVKDGESYEGKLKEVTCLQCLELINFIKKLK